MTLNYKLVSAVDGSLKKQASIMSENMPTPDAPGRGTQTSFRNKKGIFNFIDKHEFPYEIVDMDVGDLNGNGKNEIVIIDRYRVMIFKNKKGKLHRITQIETAKTNYFLGVDVADINNNGRAEIFVTNNIGIKLESFALEIKPKKKKFDYIWKDANLYFRVIRPMGKRPILMSQTTGFNDPFYGPIKRVVFKKGKYRISRKLNTPEVYGQHFILYGLTQQDLNGDGKPETIVLDNDYHLRVYSQNGRLVVKSNDYYGHDPRLIEVGVEEDVSGTILGAPVRLKGRLEFVQLGANKFLVLPMNKIMGNGLISRLVVPESSGLALLRVTGEGFEKAFNSSKQKGFMAAFRVIPYKGGKSARVYALRIDKNIITNNTYSTLTTYDWPVE